MGPVNAKKKRDEISEESQLNENRQEDNQPATYNCDEMIQKMEADLAELLKRH